MKYLFVLFSVFPIALSAQSIDVFVFNTNLEFSGGSYDVSSNSTNDVMVDLMVVNNTGVDQSWTFQRILPVNPHWDDDWMVLALYTDPFGGLDFIIQPDSVWTTPIATNVPINDSLLHVRFNYKPVSDGCDTYHYYILDNGIRVDSFTINLCKTAGLSEFHLNQLEIFPNPSSSELNLNFQDQTPKEIEIMDVIGNKIATFDAATVMKIPTDHLSNGIYFLSWRIDQMHFSQTFQVQH